ncbi:YxeA family protein [Bacillus sp. 3103sda1]|uniref:YxeA family protein n=1 Tax=Bacillus sp. 3103sda1 TaxID=2953808 RepID=UPI0020A0A0AD|nr:YxeA family protein [Bacillus sp. 3103sda1]MCP1126183.1 YxeA family protein [Bacillus sp. 3103sda1]
MRMILKVTAVLAVLGGAGVFYLQSKTEGVQAFVDNFFSGKEVKDYYAVTNQAERKGNKYLYTFTAYDRDGNEQVVKKMINRELCQGVYLKVYAKGSQGKGWAELRENEVPTKVLEKLKK